MTDLEKILDATSNRTLDIKDLSNKQLNELYYKIKEEMNKRALELEKDKHGLYVKAPNYNSVVKEIENKCTYDSKARIIYRCRKTGQFFEADKITPIKDEDLPKDFK